MICIEKAIFQGANASKILHQCTTRSGSSYITEPQISVMLNRQGRVLALVRVTALNPEAYYIEYPAPLSALIKEHLDPFLRLSRVRAEWRISQIFEEPSPQLVVPWIVNPIHSGLWTAFDLSCDLLGYIDFQKGCYLGQEIVARIYAKDQISHKKRLGIWTGSVDKVQDACLYSYHHGSVLAVLSKDLWHLQEAERVIC
ncbi:MAG: hypothetical protein FJ161_05120 [Gammaproteobacteria bacterium]|nr:hypothetical protein [Gammaproteobacteria bacterium]